MRTLAIDIGGTKFSVALFDGDAMVRRESRRTDRAAGREWLLGELVPLCRELLADGGVARCGVGFGGPVLFDRQVVATSTHVGGWSDFPLTAYLADSLQVPVVMDNDANVGALGEGHYGAGRGAWPLFYMTLSTGIGGGILNGQGHVERGADCVAGEIGHITLQPDGPECLCGARGCFERLCCGLWLERDYGRPAQELLQDSAFVERYVVFLAQGIKAGLLILNPARFVVGGGLSKAGERLFKPLYAEIRRQMTPWARARRDVLAAELGDDSVLYGALALSRQHFTPTS